MKYYYLIDRDYMKERYQDEIAGLSKELTESVLFEKYLEILPIFIHPGDLFAGWYGYPGKMPEDLEAFVNKKNSDIAVKRADLLANGDPRTLMDEKYCYYAIGYDSGHNLLDYGTMIGRGLNAYIKDVEEKLKTVVPEAGRKTA